MMRNVAVLLLLVAEVVALGAAKRHHHKKHHHFHHAKSNETTNATNVTVAVAADSAVPVPAAVDQTQSTQRALVDKMKALEEKIESDKDAVKQGRIIVNGPLPTDFGSFFAKAVAEATGCNASVVKVIESHSVEAPPSFIQMAKAGEVEVVFEAPGSVVDDVLAEAADAESKLVNGPLYSFLVAKDDGEDAAPADDDAEEAKVVDVDTSQMPYGELEPFGRENTAQQLTEDSITQSDAMVDQLERAEVAEEKRSVFRAITRLRGAAITSFDGIARSQTGNIDEYNHNHKWRTTHPLHHLAQDESDVSKWAFPSNAD